MKEGRKVRRSRDKELSVVGHRKNKSILAEFVIFQRA